MSNNLSSVNIYNSKIAVNKHDPNQPIYDAFNTLVTSSDRIIFFKLATKIELFHKIKNIPGDIVECGVFKGSGLMVWLKLLDMYSPHSIRQVIGFDFFDSNFVDDLDGVDKEAMSQVFTRCDTSNDISTEAISEKILNAGFSNNKFELVKGDLSETSKNYVKSHPGMRISLLYMDVDLEKPTYDALCNMWDNITPGGIIVFDEYGYHSWTESNAVDRFIKNKGIELHPLDVACPTAYIVKPK